MCIGGYIIKNVLRSPLKFTVHTEEYEKEKEL